MLQDDTEEGICMSLINIKKIKKYKKSLQSTSNVVSTKYLQGILESNRKCLEGSLDQLLSTSMVLIQNKNNAKPKLLSEIPLSLKDPIALFEQSTPICAQCSMNNTNTGIDDFFNNECQCDLDSHKTKIHRANAKENVPCIRTLSSEGSSQVTYSQEQRPLFKPKFGNSRYAINKSNVQFTHASEEHLNPVDEVQFSKAEEEEKAHKSNVAKITFKTAKEQLLASNPAAKRTLGASRKAQSKFVSPMIGVQEKQEFQEPQVADERLKHIDPKMVELIESEIMDKGAPIGWDDVAGLRAAKAVLQEAVVWPLLRPELFTGLRRPPRGVLLFGPPGTGKTLIGKCVSSQCRATFFSISASSLTSKWVGDGEKMVRALFAVARCRQPAVIFIDEIDSLLSARSDSEHEASRRIKTEFLVQLDGATTGDDDRLLVVGATNRPHELDEAARRRLVKRLYIPLPDLEARRQMVSNLLKHVSHSLSAAQEAELAARAQGYSGADVRALCAEAAMGPVRAVPLSQIPTIDPQHVRPVCFQDFINALQRVKPSVSQDDLGQYVKWNETYGHGF